MVQPGDTGRANHGREILKRNTCGSQKTRASHQNVITMGTRRGESGRSRPLLRVQTWQNKGLLNQREQVKEDFEPSGGGLREQQDREGHVSKK